jgi:hypothetical protein
LLHYSRAGQVFGDVEKGDLREQMKARTARRRKREMFELAWSQQNDMGKRH